MAEKSIVWLVLDLEAISSGRQFVAVTFLADAHTPVAPPSLDPETTGRAENATGNVHTE